MKYEHVDLVEEFYLQIAKDYNLTFEEVKKIVIHPWEFTKEVMESGTLDKVRLKDFGTFTVYPGSCKSALGDIYKRFEKGYITSKRYFELKEMLEKYLERVESGEIKKHVRSCFRKEKEND